MKLPSLLLLHERTFEGNVPGAHCTLNSVDCRRCATGANEWEKCSVFYREAHKMLQRDDVQDRMCICVQLDRPMKRCFYRMCSDWTKGMRAFVRNELEPPHTNTKAVIANRQFIGSKTHMLAMMTIAFATNRLGCACPPLSVNHKCGILIHLPI